MSFSGDLRASGVPVMRLHLLSLACEDGPGEIVVDLSGVTWLDRDGIEPLIEARRLQVLRGAVLRLGEISAVADRFLKAEPHLAQILEGPAHPMTVSGSGQRPGQEAPGSQGLRLEQAEVETPRDEIGQVREALSNRGALSPSRSSASEQDH
ncbi:hypothetical protein LWF15_29570 [Kineosporia rhizophila]|uniref:STAS domain-containing protein n=1 Tax=Kineosporia TaxID=49184 RepID=UPI001E2B7CF8|nr:MULTISPECIES: hypothetical protein [Kineosporia]MCE0539656.1 hypothetical protein [Kineosporia rhizophila]